ncbi:MAG: ABC transporter ATP-binding protein [Pseudomonadota bacterium]
MASVDIVNIRKSYGPVLALSDIDIQIESGAFFTLLGPSGCGKTTLLRTIAGFHFQDSGTILINGREIQNMPAHKRGVGMVFQDYAVFPHLSVSDNVAFGLKRKKFPSSQIKPKVAEALRIVQLEEFAHRMPHELSGGQQQRVGLARAIAVDPTVLLMDEPLSNLDAKLRVDLRGELRRIQKDMGMTTIYVTHDQEEALAMSDVVCVMFGGIIQQAASPFEIYRNPANRFVANFVGANNFLAGSIDPAGDAILTTSGLKVRSIADSASDTDIAVSVRPEAVNVSLNGNTAGEDMLTFDGNIRQISFIGRELEVHGKTELGDDVRAILRPTSELLGLAEGDPVTFAFSRDQAILFENGETGRRLS